MSEGFCIFYFISLFYIYIFLNSIFFIKKEVYIYINNQKACLIKSISNT